MGPHGVKLFIDECLSPRLAAALNATGEHDAIHPRDRGRLGDPDHVVVARCLNEDRVIVTENAVDFRKLLGREDLHPGLIILPPVDRDVSLRLLSQALAFLVTQGPPDHVMVNRVLEITVAGDVELMPRNA